MWTSEHTMSAFDFFTSSGRRRLIVYLEPNSFSPQLFVQTTLPDQKIPELMYFILDSAPLSIVDFEKQVQYGTIEGPLMESLLRLMQGVYVPVFAEDASWPDSVKRDFVSQLHKFMAVLTVYSIISYNT
jgi:dynein heavy chain